MKKENFVLLIMGTIGGLLFSLGMCMCLLQEWNAFKQGVIITAIGIVVFLVMIFVYRKMKGKPPIQWNGKAIGTVTFGIVSTLVLGTGMCMVMVMQNLMIPGIIVGIVGILMLMCLIPICKGLT